MGVTVTDAKDNLQRFSRLGLWYILALSAVATVIIIGQALIQTHLHNQLSDSQVVNVAGKQRMLSQRMVKTVLRLRSGQSADERRKLYGELNGTVALWKTSQDGLLHGNDSLHLYGDNSEIITAYFDSLHHDFEVLYTNADGVLAVLREDLTASDETLRPYRDSILLHEGLFLAGMERIVRQYTAEAQHKVSRLSYIEYGILGISLLVIILEISFIFRPTAARVTDTVRKLVASERNARKLSQEIGALYTSLERSYEQISLVREPQESPQLYAKADHGGNLIFIAPVYEELTGIGHAAGVVRICDLFDMSDADDWMDVVIDTVSEGGLWQGDLRILQPSGERGWVEVTITPVYNAAGDVDELLILGTNITKRKLAEKNMDRKNRAEIEKKINQQKFRSVLILEGQEEERKRIAMDIHDGIGQMLTSLKYQIESIDVQDAARARQKIGEVDALIKLVIKEVRKVTFNLKPPVLGDYGLKAALNVFVQEIGKLTETKLVYVAIGEPDRLPQKVENNIFRIIQEAVNNAIKYAGARTITVALDVRDTELVLTVNDDGKGFDPRIVDSGSTNIESGRGFFNMHERTEYIHGNLQVESVPGVGTTVRLMVPVHSARVTEPS